jgi:hypothetical protein
MLPTAFVVDHTKLTMLSISFLIVGVSFNAYAWMVGQFVTGFAGAVLGVGAPIFIVEIAQHDI